MDSGEAKREPRRHDFSGPPRYKGSDRIDCKRGCGASLDQDDDYVYGPEECVPE